MEAKSKAKVALGGIVQDDPLVDNLFESYTQIGTAYISGKPKQAIQNVGLFVESAARVIEHLLTGQHPQLSARFNLDKCIERLEKLGGRDGLRIIGARLSRVLYDFRTRKSSVHLKAVDPLQVDAELVTTACSWIMIEILKESGLSEAEAFIELAATRKTVLVQEVAGVLRTTNSKLNGGQRLLLVLYSSSCPLDEDQLHKSTNTIIKTRNHLRTNLESLRKRDMAHRDEAGRWQIFGKGYTAAESIISKFTKS
ncbi:hypothetical protein KQH82_08150 [bacterium]|nr:hypothetical protein [bacterium]